jgi:hypothetical protein
VVELAMNILFDMLEVTDHAILVELISLAIDGDNPIVTVQVLTLAFVG